MTDKIVVFSTCSKTAEGKKLARHLIEQRLAACVNVVTHMDSFYRWKGAVREEKEVLLVIKTSRPLLDRIRAEMEKMHSYEIPELIAVPVVDGALNYLNWMEGELDKVEALDASV